MGLNLKLLTFCPVGSVDTVDRRNPASHLLYMTPFINNEIFSMSTGDRRISEPSTIFLPLVLTLQAPYQNLLFGRVKT